MRSALALAGLAMLLAGCGSGTTSRMPAAMQQRLDRETIVRREDDAKIRYTRGAVRRQWDEGIASIVLTRQSFVIHKNDKLLFEVTPANRSRYHVRRDHDRVIVASAAPASHASWSFRPRDGDAPGWAKDLRATLGGTASDAALDTAAAEDSNTTSEEPAD